MPVYVFDIELNGNLERDEAGRHLETPEVARRLALEVVTARALARDKTVDFQCTCVVRTVDSAELYRSSLDIRAWTPAMQKIIDDREKRRAEAKRRAQLKLRKRD